jgi:succinate-acetate transporter protein
MDVEKGNIHHYGSPYLAAASPQRPKLANPAALGLFSFASSTFILSLYNVNARGIETPNVVLGMAIFCGGLAQLLAGMWEFPSGNMFGATAFTSYGAFWMSYATILIPGSGVLDAYKDPEQLTGALGIYLMTWMMVTFLFLVAALRKSIAFIALFSCLTVTFLLLAVGFFNGAVVWTHAGGSVGIVTAMIAYYIGLADLLKGQDKSIVQLPLGAF